MWVHNPKTTKRYSAIFAQFYPTTSREPSWKFFRRLTSTKRKPTIDFSWSLPTMRKKRKIGKTKWYQISIRKKVNPNRKALPPPHPRMPTLSWTRSLILCWRNKSTAVSSRNFSRRLQKWSRRIRNKKEWECSKSMISLRSVMSSSKHWSWASGKNSATSTTFNLIKPLLSMLSCKYSYKRSSTSRLKKRNSFKRTSPAWVLLHGSR